jgi:hypothetical protein
VFSIEQARPARLCQMPAAKGCYFPFGICAHKKTLAREFSLTSVDQSNAMLNTLSLYKIYCQKATEIFFTYFSDKPINNS